LDRDQYAFIAAGAGTGDSIRESREAFRRWRIVPRVLKNISQRSTAARILSMEIPFPLMLAPIRGLSYIQKDGEMSVARAAVRLGLPFILSGLASATIEEVAKAMGTTPRLLQLYPCSDEEVTESFLNRAEKSGYSGVVMTVDMSGHAVKYYGPRTSEYDKYGTEMYFSDPIFRSRLKEPPEKDRKEALDLWRKLRSSTFTWDDVKTIRGKTKLPLVLKGILRTADVEESIKYGVSAIVVSNHGGRNLDGTIAPIDVIREVSDLARNRLSVLMDSGITSGVDVIKAIALGADAVLIGKAYIYGLVVGGEEGIVTVIKRLVREIDSALALCGCTSTKELDASFVRRT
jgi:isopentenyl diphosphate isomerase/L-lactate dehydrogenase-like FMN-dependent dehydrogenase